jgi:predicted NAD/FAD-dependent oxidoreductase
MKTDVLILGAGMAGLAAARVCQEKGLSVQIIDKGRGVGGRVATRRLGPRDTPTGRWDHGAQFVTLRSPALLKKLEEWNTLHLLEPWMPAHSEPDRMRLCPREGMNAFAKALSAGILISNSERIVELRKKEGITAISESGAEFTGKACICTLPAPQLLDLLNASPLTVSETILGQLSGILYTRTLSLLAELDGPSGIPEPGYWKPQSGILDSLIDHHQKGISQAYTVTAHATPEFSLEWYDRDRNAAASVLRAAVSEKIASPISSVQIHGWKFSSALRRVPAPCLQLSKQLFASGDGFEAGDETVSAQVPARIESALLSGIAAARALGLPTSV